MAIKVTEQVQQQMAIIASQIAEVEYGDGMAAIQKLIETIGAERFGIDVNRKGVNFQFMFPTGKEGFNFVRVELNPTDTYDVLFGSVQHETIVHKKEVDGMYFDQLTDLFNRTTGHTI